MLQLEAGRELVKRPHALKELKMSYKIKREAGTTLIEIMVSIVVIAVGLLGLASMQINALKFQQTASQRSEAMQASYDLADRMRANFVFTTPDLAASERTANESKYTSTGTYASKSSAAHTSPNNCGTVTPGGACTTLQVAANDLEEWQLALKRRLAGGAGYIVPIAGTTNSTFDVTIMWQEASLDAVDTTCPTAVTAPKGVRCFTVRISI